jgi:hypothetical protein
VGCLLECGIEYALSSLTENRCIPWYYPAVDPKARVCDPFEVKEFNRFIENMPEKECEASCVVKALV